MLEGAKIEQTREQSHGENLVHYTKNIFILLNR